MIDCSDSDSEWMDVEQEEDEEEEDDRSVASDDSSLQRVKCLFCTQNFPKVELLLLHCNNDHSFNICSLMQKNRFNDIDYIKLINFIRVHNTKSDVLMNIVDNSMFCDDCNMKPFNCDDLLLHFDIENYILENRNNSGDCTSSNIGQSNGVPPGNPGQDNINIVKKKLEEANNKVKLLAEEVDRKMKDLELLRNISKERLFPECTAPAAQPPSTQPDQSSIEAPVNYDLYDPAATSGPIERLTANEDNAYASGYSHYSIHQEMLQDKVRTTSYMDAILKNADSFKDKVVLDIGCGTGILSMFAAKAGAKHVYAVDMSEIAYIAQDIVIENGYKDKITILKGRMEDIILPVENVDVIISEWMGYFLLFESMLDTVLWSRDRYLNKGGYILPNKCSIHMCAVSNMKSYERDVDFWKDVYGFKMTSLGKHIINDTQVDTMKQECMISQPICIKEIDILTCRISDLDYYKEFQVKIDREADMTCLLSYFDINFDQLPNKVYFSTSPSCTPTHWQQTIFMLKDLRKVNKDEILDCHLECKKHPKDPRALSINLSIDEDKYKFVME